MSTDKRGQLTSGPRVLPAVAVMVVLIGVVLSQFYTTTPAFRAVTENVTTCAGCGGGSMMLLAMALAAALVGVAVSWCRGGGHDGDG